MKLDSSQVGDLRDALARVCPPERLQLGEVEIYRGPSPCSPQPVMIFTLEQGPDLPPVNELGERFDDFFPALVEARAGRPGRKAKLETLASTVARLAAGLLTDALRLDVAAGPSAKSVKSEAWFDYFLEPAGVQALKAALVAVGSRISGSDDAAAAAEAARIKEIVRQRGPCPEAAMMIAAARKRDIPYLQIAENHALWQFGWGDCSEHFWVTSSNADGMVAQRLAKDKEIAKRLLRQLGIPTPADILLLPGQDLQRAVRTIGWPCVVKPRAGGSGKGVTTDIRDFAILQQAVALARKSNPQVLIESHLPGEDHRLMVIDGKLIAAVKRERPIVVGDGTSTIGELIDALNATRQGDKRSTGYLSPVPRDAALVLTLAGQHFTQESVPAAGEKILLRGNANRSTGATCTNVLDQVHPQVRYMAEELAGAFGFRATGIDYVTTDISREPDEVGGGVIELNITPGVDVLIAAGMGEDEISALVLGTRPGRIPVRLLLAPAEVQAEIASMLRQRMAATMGAASEEWIQIGELTLPASGLDPVERAHLVLRYPTMSEAVLLWTVETLCQYGLPVDAVVETVIVGSPPPADWLALLKKSSNKVTSGVDARAALEAVLRGPGRAAPSTRAGGAAAVG